MSYFQCGYEGFHENHDYSITKRTHVQSKVSSNSLDMRTWAHYLTGATDLSNDQSCWWWNCVCQVLSVSSAVMFNNFGQTFYSLVSTETDCKSSLSLSLLQIVIATQSKFGVTFTHLTHNKNFLLCLECWKLKRKLCRKNRLCRLKLENWTIIIKTDDFSRFKTSR